MPWMIGLAVCIGVCVVSALACLYLARKIHVLQLDGQKNAAQVHTLLLGAQGMGRRILALEVKMESLLQRQEEWTNSEPSVYQQANQLLDRGADASTVASNCGISNSEAQLMALVRSQLKSKVNEPSL